LAGESDSGWALGGQAVAGLLLGAAWSPCIGPTLGAAIALAARGEDLARAGAVMAMFALGVSTLILGLAYGARATLQRRKATLRALARLARPIMGATFVLVGLALFFELQRPVETWLLDTLPPWLTDLSVAA
jgi:cytochrome c biogenesis protein CcdA